LDHESVGDIDDLQGLDYLPSDSDEEDHVEIPASSDDEAPILSLPGPIAPSRSTAAPTLSLPPWKIRGGDGTICEKNLPPTPRRHPHNSANITPGLKNVPVAASKLEVFQPLSPAALVM
jgi:hypothetical protein